MTTLRVVGISGSLGQPSRTTLLTSAVLNEIASQANAQLHLIEIAQLAPLLAHSVQRSQLSPTVESALSLVESADILVAATPVYRGAYTGLFKHFFDLVDQNSLVDVPVILAATGGSYRHALIVDHVLRPLFSFFRAHSVPSSLYATAADFAGEEIADIELKARVVLAARQALRLLGNDAHEAPRREDPIQLRRAHAET